ncbi:MAG TPA: hypothetical protein VF817_03015 [Patescibacteria group bacterium]
MTKRTVVIRRQSGLRQPNIKRKIQPIAKTSASQRLRKAGFIHPVFIVLACTAFSGLFYMYSINQTATKGLEIQAVEKQMAQEKNENESLKIKEAELESLYHVEDASKQLNMVNADHVTYLEQSSSVAYSTAAKEFRN